MPLRRLSRILGLARPAERLGRLFSPTIAVDVKKVRVGRECDGGYIMLDDFSGIAAAFSFGIGSDASWDFEIASRDIPTFQFDHTIVRSPVQHPNLHFRRQKIEPDSLAYLLAPYETSSCILKMDIEDAEWEVLARATTQDLCKFRQIVCEFHWFDRASKDVSWCRQSLKIVRRIQRYFSVIHIHGNNHSKLIRLGSLKFPNVLEVTFASRLCYRFTGVETEFPTSLDRPNLPDLPDLNFHLK
jgi:hypothetical protein